MLTDSSRCFGSPRPAAPLPALFPRVLALAACLLGLLAGPLRAQTVRSDLVMTNGQINAELAWGGRLFLGGSFTNVGPRTGGGVPVDTTTGALLAGFPQVNGTVNAVVPDSAGGWYVAGAFTSVGGVARRNLAHVLSDLSVAAWDPSPDQPVFALAFHGGVVYAGGDFANVGGTSRARIAALDSATAAATAWNPGADATVRALVATDSVVYAGGDFATAGGSPRARIAALDVTSGAATAWNPNSNGSVYAMDAGGGVVYAGGFFSSIGGQSRIDLAALDPATGSATSWNPKPDNQVFTIVAAGARVYVGGAFSKIGLFATRNRIGAIDASTGAPIAGFDPNANGRVLALWVNGATIYAGGEFTTLGGQPRTFAASVDSVTGAPGAWNPSAYGAVYAFAPGGASLYVGGAFNGIGGAVRHNLAAVDLVTGALTAWDPNANGQVLALAPRGGTLLVGGQFSNVGGLTRNNAAALDTLSGLATAWDPNASGQVSALDVNSGTIYAGGTFASIGGQPRNNLAALDSTLGAATAWNPNVNGQVFTIVAANGALYLGGSFSNVGGQSRHDAAAVSATTGLPTAWDPNSNGTVRTLVATCGSMFASGFFTTIGGQTRNRVAQLDPATGLATSWNANADGPTLDLALTGGALYASGLFTNIGGQARSRVASLDPVTALATPWNPGADNIVRAFAIDGSTIYVGGGFGQIAGQTVANLAGLGADSTLSCPAIAVAPASLPADTAGVAYTQTIAASGAVAPYCYAVTAGALPPGLALDPSTGQLTGVASLAGDFAFTVTATGARGCTGVRPYTLHVAVACPAIAIGPSPLPLGHIGEAYVDTLHAGAGTPPFTFSVSAGALPAGLTLSPAGAITGTPTALGAAAFTVLAVDSLGCSGATALSISVFPACAPLAVTPELLADGVAGVAYADTLRVSGGRAPYAWAVASGTLPAGLALDAATGRVSGTPSAADNAAVVFAVTDSTGCAGTGAYTLAVFASPPASTLAASTTGLMLTNTRTLVSVPVVYTRAESDSVSTLHFVARIDTARFALRTPATPDSSVRRGPWLDAAPGATFTVTDRGAGAYAIDIALAGSPCGLGAGGTVALLDLVAAGTDGAGTIGISSVRGRDCAGAIVPVAAGAPAGLTVNRAPLVVRPAALPGGVVGVAYARTLSTDSGTAPVLYAVTAGALPNGLALVDSTGALTGTPTDAQSAYFTITATDAFARTGTRSYNVTVFATAPTSFVLAQTAGACVTTATPHASVPFVFARNDSTPARAVSVTFAVDTTRLALVTPGVPTSSIHAGGWFGAFGNTSFFVTDNGGGTYTVDLALLGSPCGITTGGTLFTVDLAGVGADGPTPVRILSVRARDCANAPIPVAEGPDANVAVDRTGPAPIADLVAAEQAVAGATAATTKIALTWTAPAAGLTVDLYRAPYGTYPLYVDATSRPDSSLVPAGPWTHVASAPAGGYVDAPPSRGVWSYVLVVADSCGGKSVSNETAGTPDYFLADVSDAATPGTGNDAVGPEDVSLLGAHYGITGAAAVDPYGYLDVGPTADGTAGSRPLPDHQIDFEDLVVFAESYGIATGPPAATLRLASIGRPVHGATAGTGGPEGFSLAAPSLVEPGGDVTVTLHLAAGGRMLGFAARLAWDKTVVEPVTAAGSGLIERQGGLVLSPAPGAIDAALLGAAQGGIAGDGDVARFTFRVLRKGIAGIHLASVDARDLANQKLATGVTVGTTLAAPDQTLLLAPAPNPARGGSAIAFALARAGRARLALYAVNGRLVRTLVNGPKDAGVYSLPWDGKDDDGRIAAAGVYYILLEADGKKFNRSLVFLR